MFNDDGGVPIFRHQDLGVDRPIPDGTVLPSVEIQELIRSYFFNLSWGPERIKAALQHYHDLDVDKDQIRLVIDRDRP